MSLLFDPLRIGEEPFLEGRCAVTEASLRTLEVRLLHMIDRARYYFEIPQALPLLEELQQLTSDVRKSARE